MILSDAPEVTKQLIDAGTAAMNGVMGRIDALAVKLGMAAQYVFTLYVKQAIINGIELLLGTILLVVASRLFFMFGNKAHEVYSNDKYDNDGVAFVFLYLGSIISAFVAAMCLFNAIDLLANPQYWALHKLIDQIKNM